MEKDITKILEGLAINTQDYNIPKIANRIINAINNNELENDYRINMIKEFIYTYLEFGLLQKYYRREQA